jgi:hypothetical protein
MQPDLVDPGYMPHAWAIVIALGIGLIIVEINDRRNKK